MMVSHFLNAFLADGTQIMQFKYTGFTFFLYFVMN